LLNVEICKLYCLFNVNLFHLPSFPDDFLLLFLELFVLLGLHVFDRNDILPVFYVLLDLSLMPMQRYIDTLDFMIRLLPHGLLYHLLLHLSKLFSTHMFVFNSLTQLTDLIVETFVVVIKSVLILVFLLLGNYLPHLFLLHPFQFDSSHFICCLKLSLLT